MAHPEQLPAAPPITSVQAPPQEVQPQEVQGLEGNVATVEATAASPPKHDAKVEATAGTKTAAKAPVPINDAHAHLDLGRKREDREGYLEGLRGIIAFEVLLWSFFRIFAPAIVTPRDVDYSIGPWEMTAPEWQHILRKAMSPLFWDGTLQPTFFFILSGRVVSASFLESRTNSTLAGLAFRRPLRLVPPVMIAFLIATIVSITYGFSNAETFSLRTQNSLANQPTRWTNAIQYFNAVMSAFWSTDPNTIAVTWFPVRGIIWTFPLIFTESFTAYTVSCMLPVLMTFFKFAFLSTFIAAAWWIGSWAWYTLTGLLIAELCIHHSFAVALVPLGIPLPYTKRRLPMLVPAFGLLCLGLVLKYLWADVAPSRYYDELAAHASFNTGGLRNGQNRFEKPVGRLDDYFIATGAFLLLEGAPGCVKKAMGNPVFTWLGRLSFSLYLIQGPILLSFGTYLSNAMADRHPTWTAAQTLAILFFSCAPLILVSSAVFHFLIEEPSRWCAGSIWRWIRE